MTLLLPRSRLDRHRGSGCPLTYTIEQDLELEDLPVYLLAKIRTNTPNSCAIEIGQPCQMSPQASFIEGSRNNSLFKLACRLRGHEGMEQRDLERILMVYNQELCFPPLDAEEVLEIVASACRHPAETVTEKSLRRQNENPLWWFRFDVRYWFSDQNLNAMWDFQTGWYMRLYVFAWNKGGFLTTDTDSLWRLAGARSRAHFEKHCGLVLADFEWLTEHDGTIVFKHRYMAAASSDVFVHVVHSCVNELFRRQTVIPHPLIGVNCAVKTHVLQLSVERRV
jgi:hypothetical protein